MVRGVQPDIMKAKISASFAFLLAFAAGIAAGQPVLEKGMPAAEILKLAGKPAEIVPMKTPEGRAEKWIYRRKVGQTINQTANTQAHETAMVGFGGTGGVVLAPVVVPEYRLKYVVGYQVTALLMIDGKLQLGRQWYEREEKFAD
jgi:hypothetical protein